MVGDAADDAGAVESGSVSGRGRVGVLAAAVAAVIAAVLAAHGCADDPADDVREAAPASQASAAAGDAPKPRPRRAPVQTETPEEAATAAPPGEQFLVDGWPAAQIVVRRPDGHVAPGACVYVHPAGADTPPSLDEIPRLRADSEGRVTFVAPAPGRYDVGAFEGPGFATLLTDVEFPARGPVEIVLPETARLEIRSEGELPPTGRVSLWAASAVRVTAFPGRRESKYVGFGTDNPAPQWLEVPRGVPMRVVASGGVVAEPAVVTAPGTITVRADDRRLLPFEFVFTGAAAPPEAGIEYELRVTLGEGGAESERTLIDRAAAGARLRPAGAEFRRVPGPTEVRWELVGTATGRVVVDTSRPPEDRVFRVEIPVADWGPCASGIRVRVHGGDVATATLVTEVETTRVETSRELQLVARGVRHVAAFGPAGGPVLAAGPVVASTDRIVDLSLAPAGTVRIAVEWSRPFGAGWPVTVERGDGVPLLLSNPPGRIQAGLFAQARIDGVTIVIGPFAAGDVELVFRLAGREFGRRVATVRANEVTQVIAPPIVPPGRR
jgi:hypothetical protein